MDNLNQTATRGIKLVLNKIKKPILRNETAIAESIFASTNEERKKAGVHPLQWSNQLANVAKGHSVDMIENGYFEHNEVNLGENIGEVPISLIPFFIMVEDCFITFTDNQIAACFILGWVNSPGHYQNMIRSSYSYIGVGVSCNLMICRATQNFI